MGGFSLFQCVLSTDESLLAAPVPPLAAQPHTSLAGIGLYAR